MTQDYTLGFAFSADRSKVVMIEKKTPAWQAGKLNGIGGKLEPGETAIDAMCREFMEECGVRTEPQDWHYFTKIIGRFGNVFCYRMFDDKVLAAKTLLAEEVKIMDVSLDSFRQNSMTNIPWLLGIALDESQPIFFVEANYNQEFATGKTGTND